jgi:MEDS: MEthanogen/methylotroph, DcmR Sensory domain
MQQAKKKTNQIFWGEIAPCDHIVQIYEEDEAFLNSLEAFVVAGLRAKEAVVLIATPQHHAGLERRLWAQHFDLIAGARSRDQYITFDADDTLSRFMVNDWPDEQLFKDQISSVLDRARSNGTRVRAFGEMVALLWARGLSGATVRLEHLWNHFCQKEGLPLFCAYPKSGFTKDTETSMREICAAHTKSVCC